MQRFCSFPQLPIQQGQHDTRVFTNGERVCLRNQAPAILPMGIYRNPVPQPGTGRVFTHIVDSPDFPGRFVDWENVGKFVPAVNPAAARLVAESAGLSENIERLIGKYGGKRKMRKTRKQQRKRKQIRKKT